VEAEGKQTSVLPLLALIHPVAWRGRSRKLLYSFRSRRVRCCRYVTGRESNTFLPPPL
jgi:hypothetical protein